MLNAQRLNAYLFPFIHSFCKAAGHVQFPVLNIQPLLKRQTDLSGHFELSQVSFIIISTIYR